MPFAFWCILIAALLPLCWAIVAKVGISFDNHSPRIAMAQATGYRQRAHWAQQNAWEAFAPFASACIIAYFMNLSPHHLNSAAAVFICARIAHGLCYLANWASLRSLCWFIGLVAVLYLFIASA